MHKYITRIFWLYRCWQTFEMIKFNDILILIVEMIIYFISGVFILAWTDYPFLVLPLFLLFIVVHYSIKRNKKILEYVKKDFEKMGFEIIDEKPIPLFESDVSVKPTVIVNGLPISRYGYMRQFGRIFKAKDKDGQLYELNAISTKLWNGENKIEIKNKKRLPTKPIRNAG